MNARPQTLSEVATRSASLAEFGLNLRDWLHELRRASSRNLAMASIANEPPRLASVFEGGEIADAWLAAYAEYLSQKLGRVAPEWAFNPGRILKEPGFDSTADSPLLRALALSQSPAAFKRRNLYTPSVDLPLRLRAGRPVKSAEERRANNAERQRRFRKARREELVRLRQLALSVAAAESER